MRIRDAVHNDAEDIACIYNAYLGVSTMDTTAVNAAAITYMIDSQLDGEYMVVMIIDTNVVGWGRIMRYSSRHGYRYTAETSVYMHSLYTGQALGTELKQHLIGLCRQYGYHHLIAKILVENQGSLKYNMNLGYELVGIQKEVGRLNDEWIDVAIMQLIL